MPDRRPPALGGTILFLLLCGLPLTGVSSAAAAVPWRSATSAPSVSAVRATDDQGQDIRLDRPARRIVSLSPNITELVFAAGAGRRLVGVSRYSDYPASAKLLPDIGDASGLDLERIIALRPDLVIGWRRGTAHSSIEKLKRLGLPVFVIEAVKLTDIPRLLRAIGLLAGTFFQAEEAARAYEHELQQIERDHANRNKIRTVQLIWHQPLMTVNDGHVISDIINLCGGINLFASAPFLTPVISEEALLMADPEVIISSTAPGGKTEAATFPRRIQSASAVRNNYLFFIHPDLILRQSVRLLLGTKQLCAQLERVRSKS